MTDQRQPVTLPSPGSGPVEHLGAGLTLEWVFNGRIPIITPQRATREAVDIWFAAVPRLRVRWRESTTATGVIYDLSHKDFGPTPYLRHHLELIAKDAHTHVRHFTVIVLAKTFFGQVFHAMSNGAVPMPRNYRNKTFFSRDEAIAWLIKTLNDEDAAALKLTPKPEK